MTGQFEPTVEQSLASLAEHARITAMATLHQAGVARLVFDGQGTLVLEPITAEERAAREAPAPQVNRVPGNVRVLRGSGATLAWVFQGPAPYTDVEIVCSPNTESPTGFSCQATRKFPGNVRVHYDVTFTERENP